ncbi:MAG: hypothetical protein ACYTGW_03775 [Planctomycetota bacterium]|jgi:hypothetical protein
MTTLAISEQQERFLALGRGFQESYDQIRRYPYSSWVVPFWDRVERELEARLLPLPPWDFLCDDYVRGMMFVFGNRPDFDAKLRMVRTLPAVAARPEVAREDAVGQPEILAAGELETSHNTVHHLYHLAEYVAATGCNLHALATVVEWGGGYGNMARLFRRILERPTTYVIVDLPLLTCLQWLYLASVFGENQVHLVSAPGTPFQEQKINLLPVSLLHDYPIAADLFLSTWALSESSRHAQEYVVRRNGWFGARRLLLGYQKNDIHREEFVDPAILEQGVQELGGRIKPFPFGEGQHYGFA